MIYQRDPSSVALFVDRNTLAAFQKALHVAVHGTGREQTSMASVVLPQTSALLVEWSVLMLSKLQMSRVMDHLLNKKC